MSSIVVIALLWVSPVSPGGGGACPGEVTSAMRDGQFAHAARAAEQCWRSTGDPSFLLDAAQAWQDAGASAVAEDRLRTLLEQPGGRKAGDLHRAARGMLVAIEQDTQAIDVFFRDGVDATAITVALDCRGTRRRDPLSALALRRQSGVFRLRFPYRDCTTGATVELSWGGVVYYRRHFWIRMDPQEVHLEQSSAPQVVAKPPAAPAAPSPETNAASASKTSAAPSSGKTTPLVRDGGTYPPLQAPPPRIVTRTTTGSRPAVPTQNDVPREVARKYMLGFVVGGGILALVGVGGVISGDLLKRGVNTCASTNFDPCLLTFRQGIRIRDVGSFAVGTGVGALINAMSWKLAPKPRRLTKLVGIAMASTAIIGGTFLTVLSGLDLNAETDVTNWSFYYAENRVFASHAAGMALLGFGAGTFAGIITDAVVRKRYRAAW